MLWIQNVLVRQTRAAYNILRRAPRPISRVLSRSVLEVEPDMQCDFRHLPFPDETFWHIVFDPPHLTWAGEKSWTRLKYGVLDAMWPDMIHDGFAECWRVLRTNGTLIFKWSTVQISLRDVLAAIGKKPLYGNRSGKHNNTHWLAFVKFADDADDMTLF